MAVAWFLTLTVVGAPLADTANGADEGVAYLYYRNSGGADAWGEVAKLTPSDGAVEDYFGWSVAVSGDTVVVGAIYDDFLGGAGGGIDAGVQRRAVLVGEGGVVLGRRPTGDRLDLRCQQRQDDDQPE